METSPGVPLVRLFDVCWWGREATMEACCGCRLVEAGTATDIFLDFFPRVCFGCPLMSEGGVGPRSNDKVGNLQALVLGHGFLDSWLL